MTATPTEQTPAPTAAEGSLGLPQATALIMGGIIGTGIFTLPSAIAQYGMLAIVALLVVTVGAIALALMFASLVRKVPAAGGPYAYSRHYFGDFAGFTSAWPYWITAWAGNAGIVVSWTFYVQSFFRSAFSIDLTSTFWSIAISLVGLWIPALINLAGVKNMGSFQLVTTILKFVPLVIISTLGLVMAFGKGNFPAFNPSGESFFGALSLAGALALFSYLGVETASVAAAKIKDPERNVPKATVVGTLACAVVYILSTVAIFGLVPNETLQNTGAPFTDAFDAMFGGTWAGSVVALFAIISGIGALNGWTMICAEMPQAAADEGLFPRAFAKVNAAGVPWFGVIASTVLASLFTVMAFAGATGVEVFNTLVLLSGVTAAVPYFFSAMAQIYSLLTERSPVDAGHFARDMVIAVLSLLFSVWFVYGSGQEATFYAYLLILVGYVVLIGLYVQRHRRGESVRS